MKEFYKTVVIENQPFDIFEVDCIGNVEPKDNEAYFWIKGYQPDFYFKMKHFSNEYGEIEGIGDPFKAVSEDEIFNKEIYIDSAIEDFICWMTDAIQTENYFDSFEDHF